MDRKAKVCSVEGCDKKVHARGWCYAHYRRWREHGDPLGGSTSPGELLKWLEAHVSYRGTECLIWPFGLDSGGYGMIRIDGKMRGAHVIMCAITHGPKPTPDHVCRHSCGKGHEACVNPEHLDWGTLSENQMDRAEHGTSARGERNPSVKITEAQVREIRAKLSSGCTQRKIAMEYGVGQPTISRISTGEIWGWHTGAGRESS